MAERSVSIALEAQVAGFVNGIRTAQRAVTGFQSELDKSAKKRAALDQLGASAGKVGLVAAAGLGAAVMAAANFDQAMSQVEAATGETAAGMDRLREAALQAGQETAFSATEAADGIEQLAKAGVSTSDILSGGLMGALDLAAAGNISVGEAAETAAKAMTQFGLSGEQVPHVADLMAAAAGKASGEVSDFGAALNQVGLVANGTGLTIEETTGTLAAFASAGMLGSDAGTSMKTMLQRLSAPADNAARLMEKLGISAYDSAGEFVGMSNLAEQLQTNLAGMTDEQRNAALAIMFGSDAVRAANVLYAQGGEGITEWVGKVDDAGFAAETAATRLDNLKGDLEALGGALETALIGTGEGAQGPLRSLTQTLTDVVNAYNDLPGAAQTATLAIGGIATLVGGGAWVGSKMLIGISETRQALEDLGPAGDKAARGLKMLGTATVVVGGVLALDAAVDGLLGSMRDAVPGTEELTGRLLDLSNAKAGDIGAEFRGIGEDLDFLASKASMGADSFIPNVSGLIPFWENAGEQFDRATEQLTALDSALANIAASGSAEQATAALDALAKAEGLSGAQRDELIARLPQYNEALASSANAAKLAGDGASGAADGIGKVGDAAGGGAPKVQTFADSLKQLEAFFGMRSGARAYEAALDDLTASLKENGRNFDITTEKGRTNQERLDAVAGSALEVATSMRAAARTRFLTRAIADLETAGKKWGIPQREIDALTAKLEKANRTSVDPKVDADTRAADNKIGNTQDVLDVLDRSQANPSVNVSVSGVPAAEQALSYLSRDRIIQLRAQVVGGAPGGRATMGFADGGYTGRGGKYEPAGIVHRDEYVISREPRRQIEARHPGAFDYMNAYGRLPGYADGGRVGGARDRAEKRDDDRDKKDRDRRERAREKHRAKVERQLDKATDRLTDLRDDTRSLQQAAAGNFRADPFQANATLGGVLRSLQADTVNAREFRRAARGAQRLGLNGQVYRDLLASGNTDVFQAIDSRRDVRRLEAAWATRNAATRNLTVGAFGRPGGRDDTLKEMRQTVDALRAELKRLGKNVRDGAREGTEGRQERERKRRRQAAMRARG